MRVLFLIQGWKVAASRYRVLQYIPYLEEKGMEVEVKTFPRTLSENWAFFWSLPRYDVVFVQRKRLTGFRLRLFKRRARRIVYDFDDSVMYRNSTARSPVSRTRMARFARMLEACDGIIAGNEYLKREALKHNSRVEVIPSPIDIERYGIKSYDSGGTEVVLGWIGDHGSIHYLEKMRPIFDILAKKYPYLSLKIVCDNFFDCEEMKVIKKEWRHEDEVRDLQSFDIGLMPLMDDPWSWGKCGLKIVQYQGVGIPVVCTPVGINRDLVTDGENGFWASDQEEWIEKLSILVEDAGLRERMGRAGREKVERGYTAQDCGIKLGQFLENLVSA
ncbi:MAG: glycosyltransferase [Proteobacteria bacterium]|nr:glycosyltransferase [Pseudomonadota bacterium]NIS72492.1 glycosyltransferase [Pseudomonadota bacterium]